ncbi:MAG: Rid family hydrolase [Planctomycetota bacterium]|jgi:enamine deaminase RidA (YjgF/YER057c/UK114 family)
MEIERTFTGSVWEARAGYCRALRAGDHIYVSGTAPVTEDGEVFAPGDAYAQTRRCFEIVERALADLGADLRCVVRTRLFVTDASRWEVRSRTDLVQLREVEADAVHPG